MNKDVLDVIKQKLDIHTAEDMTTSGNLKTEINIILQNKDMFNALVTSDSSFELSLFDNVDECITLYIYLYIRYQSIRRKIINKINENNNDNNKSNEILDNINDDLYEEEEDIEDDNNNELKKEDNLFLKKIYNYFIIRRR